MKVQIVNNNFTFKAGLTNSIRTEISACDIKSIENYFAKRGTNANFANNKVVAWSSLKCAQFIKILNKKYNLYLSLPNEIRVEDFNKIKTTNSKALGLTNFAPTYLYKDRNVIVPEKSIFFNSNNINWDHIDEIADLTYAEGISTTNFFAESVFHEFMHVIHENNLMKKLGGERLVKWLRRVGRIDIVEQFQKKYSISINKNICKYAASSPIEMVACDLAKRGINSMNTETLEPIFNMFSLSPYNKKVLLPHKKETKTDRLLRHLWNGDF